MTAKGKSAPSARDVATPRIAGRTPTEWFPHLAVFLIAAAVYATGALSAIDATLAGSDTAPTFGFPGLTGLLGAFVVALAGHTRGLRDGALAVVLVAAIGVAVPLAMRSLGEIRMDTSVWILTALLSFGLCLARAAERRALALFRDGMSVVHGDAMMRSVVENSFEGIVITTDDGTVKSANPAASRMFGRSRDALVGCRVDTLFRTAIPTAPETADSGNVSASVAMEVAVERDDGTSVQLEMVVGSASMPLGGWPFERRRTPREIRVHSFRDVTERKRADEARKSALAEARAAAGAKTEFLRNMGHELRTPLNSVIGFSEIVKDEVFGPLGNEQYRQYLTAIHGCGIHLLEVINQILDVSRIEAGEHALDEEPIHITGLVREVIDIAQGWDNARELSLSLRQPVAAARLCGERRLIHQAVLDLVSNAVKFSEAGGKIEIAVTMGEDDRLAISVGDQGIGIAPENIDKVTVPFYQVDSALDRKFEGAGLGLYIARAYVEFHGGELTIDSTPGAGTTATLRFPPERTRRESMAEAG